MKKKKSPLVIGVITNAAEKIGARVVIEPEWGYVGQIIFKSGKKVYFRNTSLDLNPMGASSIAVDKGYAKFFLNSLGYPIAAGGTFYAKEWAKLINSKEDIDRAYACAVKLGFPVIVKPNSKSQGVAVCKVFSKKEFYQAAKNVFKKDHVMLVEKFIEGKDYRIVVLDQEVISAYERVALAVVGDGVSSVARLLAKKQREFKKSDRDTQIKHEDYRITANLSRRKMTLASVPKKGERIVLLDNANLSTGGTSIDVTETMHKDFKKLAIAITKDMGLRLCGVDMLVSGDIAEPKSARNTYTVLEINSAPGLDHYYTSGKKQQKIVEDLYLKLVQAMAK